MTLDAHFFGNPEYVLQKKQEAQLRKQAACGGCIHVSTLFKDQPRCTKKYQTFGYRCQFHQLKGTQ